MLKACSIRSQGNAVLRQKAKLRVATLSGGNAVRISGLLVASFGVLAGLTGVSNAQNTKHFCLIERISDGSIQPNIQNTEITSRQFGGYSGRLKVTATRSSYRLVVDDPLGFEYSPANAGNAAEYKTFFLGNGATNFAERPGNEPVKIKKGETFIETHFVATKLNNNTFPAGNYNAKLTLRCE